MPCVVSSRHHRSRSCSSGRHSATTPVLGRARPKGRIFISDPSWPNHWPMAELAGLTPVYYPYFDHAKRLIDGFLQRQLRDSIEREARDRAPQRRQQCKVVAGVAERLEHVGQIANLQAHVEFLCSADHPRFRANRFEPLVQLVRVAAVPGENRHFA